MDGGETIPSAARGRRAATPIQCHAQTQQSTVYDVQKAVWRDCVRVCAVGLMVGTGAGASCTCHAWETLRRQTARQITHQSNRLVRCCCQDTDLHSPLDPRRTELGGAERNNAEIGDPNPQIPDGIIGMYCDQHPGIS